MEVPYDVERFLANFQSISWFPIDIGQCETICFEGDCLIISSNEEKGDLYEVPLSQLIKIRD